MILVVYATSEGHTEKVARKLSERFTSLGHSVKLAELDGDKSVPDCSSFAAVVLAASVHAGKHQASASQFINRRRKQLQNRLTAFLSVNLSSVATESTVKQCTDEQIQGFLEQVNWQPGVVQSVADAVNYSRQSGAWRFVMRVAKALFGKRLSRDGWPDITRDKEFTDWQALGRFAEEFAGQVSVDADYPAIA